jgi:hypothetical protein
MSLEGNNYLSQLKKVNTVQELVEEILSVFNDYEGDDYIPAIIEEGTFTVEYGEDLYVKLVLKHQSIKLEKTWLKGNFVFGLEEPKYSRSEINQNSFIQNIITYRRYKSRDLYQLNPLLVSNEINEFEYKNSNYVNAFYNDEYSNLQGLPVLKYSSNNNLLVLKKALKNFINEADSNVYPKYELVAEFEYRSHSNHLNIEDSSDYLSERAKINIDKNENTVYILGSIILPVDIKKKVNNIRGIKVIDLKNLKPRAHNNSHFNGDTIEGFVCFKPEVTEVLKNHYYFYDLQIIDKTNLQNTYLVDVLEDKVVFWEAEYNKLPDIIKNKIDSYNYIPNDTKGIISEAMSAMQLEVDWNWDKKLTPDYILANLIRERILNRAIDMELSFVTPNSQGDLKQFINKIENLTGIRLERFNSNSEDVKALLRIKNGELLSKLRSEDIRLLYKKYCYAIQMEFKK